MGDLKTEISESQSEGIKHFTQYLLRDLKALELMLERGMIEDNITRIGAEQELVLVDKHWSPAPNAMELLEKIKDPHVVNEFAKFNLEINLDPQLFQSDCFSKMEQQLRSLLDLVSAEAKTLKNHLVMTGILPTLRQRDLGFHNMTPLPRYKKLNENLKRLRGGKPFNIYITGADELITQHPSSLLESCNTSFQVHLQVSPDEFVDKYNFAQLVSAPVLAAAGNSLLLFGKRLWKETRIALFLQSIDTRHQSYSTREQSPRVTFGKNWIRDSVLEIFQDDLARFRLIMHSGIEEDSLKALEMGKIPKLRALCLFNGTVYRWNRACYGTTNGKPHLRIENRVLPSGPTVIDEMANAAFWLGLVNGMPDNYRNIWNSIPFDMAQMNLLRAAKMGLDTKFHWLNDQVVPAQNLILDELLPIARQGLKQAKVDERDIKRLLSVVEKRVASRKTGSIWIFDSFSKLLEEGTRYEAAVAITAAMVRQQKLGKPIHEWPLAKLKDAGIWLKKFWRVEQIMSVDLYTVHEGDLVDLAAQIMDWKHIRHIPVEDDTGQMVGLVDQRTLLRYLGSAYGEVQLKAVKEIMNRDPITIEPQTPTLDALRKMKEHQIGCLPVVEKGKLVGMVTEYDFSKITGKLLDEMVRKNRKEFESLNATPPAEETQEDG